MPRRLIRAIALASLCCALGATSPALGVTSALVQNLDTSGYPRVVFTLVVSPDAVSAPGDVPSVAVVENGRVLRDVAVSSLVTERVPIDVVLLVDTSGSMSGQPLADAKVAARRFIESMEGDDRVAIVAVASAPVVVQEFTADRAALFSAIEGLSAAGETALYDGLVQAANMIAPSTAPERYIVALSDGGDTMSLNPPDNAARALEVAKAPVYAIALDSPEYNPATLETIAGVSGGRMTTVVASGSLADVYQSIAQEMQLRYRVECVSGRPSTPELALQVEVGEGDSAREVEVTVANPAFTASAGQSTTLDPGRPSVLALGASLLALFGATALVAVDAGLVLRKDRAALDQLRFYDQLRTGAGVNVLNTDDTSRGALLDALGEIAESKGFTGLVQRWLDSAGVALRANEYIFFHVLGTICAGALVQIVSGGALLWSLITVGLAVMVPLLFLRMMASRRLRMFNEQIPDVLDLIAGSLRSGWGIQQAIDLVVTEVAEPSRSEFGRTQAEARLGLPLEQALQRMADRIESDDLRWVVSAISIQREVGGNLAEVLNTVSRTIRERAELRRQVSALTAEGRMSLVILAVLPFLVFGALFFINPEYMMLALKAPLGVMAFVLAGLLLVVGIVWLNRVMKVEV